MSFGGEKATSRKAPTVAKASHGRSRPTNNALLYRATFQWEHYGRALYGSPKLPNATEACASVTSAFLQVVGVLFEVERLREDQPRNILRLLSTNTRRTKVVELSSGTHRVPEELKRHSIGDGEGGQYSTNLDRNRYGSDDQYLATVVRYNLEYLDLCPCLLDITILDAKGGDTATVVSAGPGACICHGSGNHPVQRHGEVRQQRNVRTVGGSNQEPNGGSHPALEAPLEPSVAPPSPAADSEEGAKPVEKRAEPAAPSKSNGGSELFDALLMAATEPQVTSRHAPLPKSIQPRGLAKSSGQDAESNGDSGVKDEGVSVADGLRRSSRKSVKLFNAAALEREGSGDSDEGMSVGSMEGDTDANGRLTRGRSDDWEGGQHSARGRRTSLPQRGASAANLSKLSRPGQGQFDTRGLQQEVRRLQQQLQATVIMLEESREQEAEARLEARRHEEELAAFRNQAEQVPASAGSRGSSGGSGGLSSAAQTMYGKVLQEAEGTIARLEHEKTILCTTLTAAGLPLPYIQSEVATPHRNGERSLNGFAPAHMGAPRSSAFSVPAFSAAAFQQYLRPPLSMTQHPVMNPPVQQLPDAGTQTVGLSTPRIQHLPSPRSSLWPGTARKEEKNVRHLSSDSIQAPSEGLNLGKSNGGENALSSKRRSEGGGNPLEEPPSKQLAQGRPEQPLDKSGKS